LVEHEKTGLMVDGNDVGSIAGALQRLTGDAELRGRLGPAGRARVVEEFSLCENVSRLERHFLAAMSSRWSGVPINQQAAMEASVVRRQASGC
jgi:glycosyltransferase involved in cell wall biosynthesis